MKIVHIISSLEMAGAQAVLYDLVCSFEKKGYEQVILFFHDGPYRSYFTERNVETCQISGLIGSVDPTCLYQIIRFLQSYRPTVVHTALWAANFFGRCAARWCYLPCFASLHNNYDQNGAVRNTIDRIASYDHTTLIAVSDEVQHSFLSRRSVQTPIYTVYNGIDVKRVARKAEEQKKLRSEVGLSDEHFVIGTVGRFHPIKQYPLLLDMFARVHHRYPHARLVLIGHGPQHIELRSYARSLHIDPYVYWIIGQQAHGYYHLFDCFVLASSKEGISIALLEAMSLAIVPVSTYHVVQHPIIEHGVSGHVAKANNATDFADAVVHILANDSQRIYMQKNAQQTVHDHFALESMIAAYDRIFRNYS